MTDIIYPTLDLYLYDLHDELGADPDDSQKKCQYFFDKIALDHSTSIKFTPPDFTVKDLITAANDADASTYQTLINLEFDGKTYNKIWFEEKNYKHPLLSPDQDYFCKGYYYPVRLNDTYGLLIDCSIEEPKEPLPTTSLKILKSYVNQRRHIKDSSCADRTKDRFSTLGETWIISAAISSDRIADYQKIAQKCYQSLMSDELTATTEEEWQKIWEDNLQGEGKISDGFLFELGSDFSEKQHHVIIALYPNQEIVEQSAKFNPSWMRLLCYRHKILYAYQQSRHLKAELKNEFYYIYKSIAEIQQASTRDKKLIDLHPILDDAQAIFCRYYLRLSSFEYQHKTIDINLYNYQLRLAEMWQKCSNTDDLNVLKKFSDLAADKYLKQTEKDLDNLNPGKTLLEGLLNSMESVKTIIEIKQAEQDRSFQNTVGILGTGLAAASIATALSTQFPYVIVPVETLAKKGTELEKPVSASWDAPLISLGVSLGAFVIGVLAALVVIQLKTRKISHFLGGTRHSHSNLKEKP